jgi:predicted dehydrogenase
MPRAVVAPLRIGILGAARIAQRALIEPAKRCPRVEVVSVAARDPARARAFAAEHGLSRSEASYAALIASPDIDAVYVALPNGAHAHWSIRALASGKHVLCEKPMASNATEAEAMVRAADEHGRVLMEAFHYRYHPLAHRVVAVVHGGELGVLEELSATFEVGIVDTDVRYDLTLAGGCLMDLGCYTVHWARTLAGEPTVESAEATIGPPGIDVAMTARLRFPSGVAANVSCSMVKGTPFRSLLEVRCERGGITVENPIAPQYGYRLRVDAPTGERAETVAEGATFGYQLEAFAEAVLDGKRPITSGEDSVANLRTIDAIYRAAGLEPRPSDPHWMPNER